MALTRREYALCQIPYIVPASHVRLMRVAIYAGRISVYHFGAARQLRAAARAYWGGWCVRLVSPNRLRA